MVWHSTHCQYSGPYFWPKLTWQLDMGEGLSVGFLDPISRCQHHYSGTVGALLSKLRVTWHKHCDTRTVDLRTEVATNPKGWEHIQHGATGQKNDLCPGQCLGIAKDFITLLGTMCNLTLTSCLFLEFSFSYFWTSVDCRQQTV